MKTGVLLLCLFWLLVEVHSQTAPYVSFMGETLPNHAYVNFSLVGDDDSGSDSVRCHTDLSTCCTSVQGPHCGGWIPPDMHELRMSFATNASANEFELCGAQRVDLRRRNNADMTSGIYRCEIPTNAVHGDLDMAVRASVYVGLYSSGGDITISNDMTFTLDSDLNGASPQLTLTCISTGGPATTVTWTRDSDTITEGTETVLDDRVTAQYTHTLTVTGRLGGLYTCTVANDKPSEDSIQLNLQAPSSPSFLHASQNGRGSVLVSWTPPSGEPAVTGYIIYYQQDGGQRLSQSAESTATIAIITGLIEGTYSITIMATSISVPSEESETAVITIEPTTISLTSSPSSPIMAGDTVTLTCSVTLPIGVNGTPDFQWEGSGVTPTPADPTTSGEVVSSDLTLCEIATSQAGQYTCTATLNGSVSAFTIITVQIPQPCVSVILHDTAHGPPCPGTGVTLTCIVALDPTVDNGERVMIEWSDLQDIPEERYSVTGVSGFGGTYTDSLTISPLADQDGGPYTCTVTVTGGSNVQQAIASDNITVTIMALPKPAVMISPDSTVTAGESHTLQCTVTHNPYRDVTPTVELIGPGDSVLATNTSFTVTHTLDPVMTSHAGQYTCRASVMITVVSVDVSGQNNSTLTVQIPQPGVDVTFNHTAPLSAGTGLTLACTVTLDPNVDNGERVMTEWSGLQDIPEERYSVTGASGSGSTYTDSLTISPLADQDDGTYTILCTGTVTGGSNVQQVNASDHVIITVLELNGTNNSSLVAVHVTISGPTTGMAGGEFQLTCSVSVVSSLVTEPTVQWSGGSVDSGDGVTESDTTVSGVTSMRNLTFSPLHTSHGAEYTCQADINIPAISLMRTVSESRAVVVQIPSPEVMMSSSTESELVSGSPLSLTCSIQPRGDSSVDTPTTLMSSWDAPNITYDRDNTANEMSVGLVISSVQTADSGDYICSASVTVSSDSVYVVDSDPATDMVNVIVNLNVTISADYTPAPGEDPGKLGPNEFTAGSDLSLICRVQGNSGNLTYTWSVMGNPPTPGCTGCDIDTSSTTSTLTVGSPLFSYHAGIYTCTVSESGRPDSDNSGDFTVRVVGAGIFGGGRASSSDTERHPIANNGLIVSGSDGLLMDCVSNSSQSGVGMITGLDGNQLPTGTTGVLYVINPYERPGVRRLQSVSTFTAAEQGIYTCSIPDNNDNLFTFNFGLYPSGFTEPPSITDLTYQEESRTLTCVSTGSPATTVSWMKDGQPLTIDGSIYHLTQTITDRSSSTYSNVLTVNETAPSGVAGTYTCTVTNEMGSDSSEVVAVDVTLSGLDEPLTVGQSATITCMTNIPVTSIEWRDQSSAVLASTTNQTVLDYTISPVTDDLHGQQFTCEVVAGATTYTEAVEIVVEVPADSLEVVTDVSEAGPVEAGSAGLTLTCTVTEVISGLTNMLSAHWMRPSGPVTSVDDIVVTETFSNDTTVTVTLSFSSLHTSHAGLYTCQGTVVSPAAVDDVTITSTPNTVTVSLPTPTLDLSVPSGPLYEGTSRTLTCTVTLPDTVDTDVTVDVQWTPVASSDRIMLSPVTSMRSPFISTLTLSPLNMSDAGQYSCEATANSSSQYITASSQGQSQLGTVAVTTLPAPEVTITFSEYSIAGQDYSLQCSASMVDGLVVLPDLKIVFPNSTEISLMNISSLDYTFSPLRASDGGQYTCTATVNIPQAGIIDLQNSVLENITVVDAYPVEDFEGLVLSETSLTFSWSPPNITAHLTTGYKLVCVPALAGIPTPAALMLGPAAISTDVTGLYSGVTYDCSISTIIDEGSSQPQTLNLTTLETVPSGAPEMFEAVAGQRQVNFSWSPPPVTQRNGLITSYTLSCSPSPSSLPQSPSQSGPLTVAGFSPDTSYSCSVVASNSQDSGPSADTTFTTSQDYSFFQLILSGLTGTCSDLVSTERDVTLEDITSAVLQQLTTSCAECGINSDIIDRQTIACVPESSTIVTYRARLEGTSETESGSLISLIEKWVSRGASIIVTGVLMTVDPTCSMGISSLSEGECSPLTSKGLSADAIAKSLAITGGVVVAVLIIAIAVIIIVIIVLNKHRGNMSIENTKKETSPPPDVDETRKIPLPTPQLPLPPIPIVTRVTPPTSTDVGVAEEEANEIYENVTKDE